MRHLKLLFAAPSRRDSGTKISRLISSHNNINTPKMKNILAESWSKIADDYAKVLVPRFEPWELDALGALRDAVNNDMECSRDNISGLVLCCGPGHELLPIAKMLGPSSTVLGTDLAPGMIAATRQRIEAECKNEENVAYQNCITAEVGDAMDPPTGPYQVMFSAFGLQQLPKPVEAIKNWISVLQPGGICVCIYWPPNPPKIPGEEDGPFELWGNLVKRKLGKQDKDDGRPWDENIDRAVAAAGGIIIQDKFITHEICWDNANNMFEGMSRAGPWHALRLRRGDEFVNDLGKELQSLFPSGESLCHKFTARMVIVRRGREEQMESSKI